MQCNEIQCDTIHDTTRHDISIGNDTMECNEMVQNKSNPMKLKLVFTMTPEMPDSFGISRVSEGKPREDRYIVIESRCCRSRSVLNVA